MINSHHAWINAQINDLVERFSLPLDLSSTDLSSHTDGDSGQILASSQDCADKVIRQDS